MGYKSYSDSYLMSLTKEQIIELLRVAEHNFFVTEEALNNSAKAGMEIAEKYDETKRLLKAAVEDFKVIGKALDEDCAVLSAADHRQLAEWLQELKKWRENPFKMIKDICANQFDCCNCPIGGYCRADDWFGYPSEWEVE